MSSDTENVEETDVKPVTKWVEGDQTHGGRGKDIKGLSGCIREKGCRELGGLMVAIFETAVAFPKRASDDERWTVVITGMGKNGPKFGTKTRKQAMEAARRPSAWSPKAAKLVEKIAAEKAEAEEKKAEKPETVDADAEVVETES